MIPVGGAGGSVADGNEVPLPAGAGRAAPAAGRPATEARREGPTAPASLDRGTRPRCATRVLLLATANPHKAAELRRLVAAALGEWSHALVLQDMRDVPGYRPVPETGVDYRTNALLKARAARAAAPGHAVLADDSGIEVDALGGAPGPLSNRWVTGPGGEPLDGPGLNAALLDRLRGVPDDRRGARMVSCVVLWLPEAPAPVVGRGEVRGRIAHEARGRGGFGYDAVFLLPDGRRLSEEPPALKDEVGHRGKAVRAVAPALRGWLGAPEPGGRGGGGAGP